MIAPQTRWWIQMTKAKQSTTYKELGSIPGKEQGSEVDRGARMADSLAKLAETGLFQRMGDPMKWQQEMRKDRPDPRDNDN